MNVNKRRKIIGDIFLAEDSSSGVDSEVDINIFEESDDDDEFIFKLVEDALSTTKRTCIRNYLEEVVPKYSDEEFRTHFRLSRNLFVYLIDRFKVSDGYQKLREDKRLDAEKHVAVYLWFAGHEECSYRDLADRFGVSLGAVPSIIGRVTMFLSNLADEAFIWPSENRKVEISTYFNNKYGFPGVIGAIDGTHITIDPPKHGKDDYIDRKGNVSICLQAICDEKARFLDIFVGYPGSTHDSRVFTNSFIYPKLKALCGDYYILGDSAYPCSEYLLTPFRDNGHLTTAQKKYNKTLSSCRVVIEHAFGIFKQRFRQMYYCKLRGIKRLCHFIRACCVLHNLAIDMEEFPLMVENPVENVTEGGSDETSLENTIPDNHLGKVLRERICEEINRKDK